MSSGEVVPPIPGPVLDVEAVDAWYNNESGTTDIAMYASHEALRQRAEAAEAALAHIAGDLFDAEEERDALRRQCEELTGGLAAKLAAISRLLQSLL